MKIGFVFDDSLDKTDGVQQYVVTLGRYFKSKGHEVRYLVGHTERKDLDGVYSLSRNLNVRFNNNRLSTPLPASRKAIKKLLSDEKFDVLHVQLPHSPFLAGRVISLVPKNVAVFSTFHVLPSSRLMGYATRLIKAVNSANLRRIDKKFSVSEPARQFALKSLGLESEVLPNVVDVDKFSSGQKIAKYTDGKVNIVFLGRLVERKGCMELLKAMNALRQNSGLDSVRLLVIGKGPLKNKLSSYINKHKLSNCVEFVGYIEEVEKPDYLATADLAVFPSLGGESFGIVLIEAMSAGAETVIAGNNVGYISVMGKLKNQIIDPKDTEVFAKVLQKYISSAALRKKTLSKQKKYVVAYDVKTVGKSLLDEYAKGVKNKKNS